MLRLKTFAPDKGLGAAPEVVDSADAGIAAEQGFEAGGVPAHAVGGKAVHGVGQRRFKPPVPLLDGAAAAFHRGAEAAQRFRRAFVPERVFQGQRHDDGTPGTRRARWARPGRRRTGRRAGIGEGAFRRDPQHGARVFQQPAGDLQESRSTARAVRFDPEDADPPHEAVLLQGGGFHRAVAVPVRKAEHRQHDEHRRVPPRGMVGIDDDRAVRGQDGQRAARQPHAVEAARGVAAHVRAEQTNDAGRTCRPHRFGWRHATLALGRSAASSATAAGLAPAPPTSWSSVSAAIQPDIMTIGIPGPGWAAPPAR